LSFKARASTTGTFDEKIGLGASSKGPIGRAAIECQEKARSQESSVHPVEGEGDVAATLVVNEPKKKRPRLFFKLRSELQRTGVK
jgi:hypothetical protein